MAPTLPPLTLIVATTPSLGIGLNGSLPWPPLKADLAFFARITKRAPPSGIQTSAACSNIRPTRNAVIMGRKTWDSLPPKVRPLKGRVNVIVSRNPASLDLSRDEDGSGQGQRQDMVMGVGSIEEGLRRLQTTYPVLETKQREGIEDLKGHEESVGLGRVFVIGGSEIYKHALNMSNCERILWTRLAGEWECDVYFPKGILPTGNEEDVDDHKAIWSKRKPDQLDSWAGEEGLPGLKEEGEVTFEIVMLEKGTV